MTSEQTDEQTPEPITFRGRNGWATLAYHTVKRERAGTGKRSRTWERDHRAGDR